jgi:hypothetical protein
VLGNLEDMEAGRQMEELVIKIDDEISLKTGIWIFWVVVFLCLLNMHGTITFISPFLSVGGRFLEMVEMPSRQSDCNQLCSIGNSKHEYLVSR